MDNPLIWSWWNSLVGVLEEYTCSNIMQINNLYFNQFVTQTLKTTTYFWVGIWDPIFMNLSTFTEISTVTWSLTSQHICYPIIGQIFELLSIQREKIFEILFHFRQGLLNNLSYFWLEQYIIDSRFFIFSNNLFLKLQNFSFLS